MPDRTDADVDRPRGPRFHCGGLARISRLPSNGIFLPGQMRDLSLGGCCVDTAIPIECGVRAELIVHVNAASFRALGEVRGLRGQSEACIQFVHLSRGGKDLLDELVAELARSQALINQLKSARRETETELFHRQLEKEKLLAAMWSERFPFQGVFTHVKSSETEQVPSAGEDLSKEAQPLVIPVRLFG